MAFWGKGFHHLLLEILAGWWLFPGITRQASVNSARAAWSGGQSCWSMGRQQWLWHTGWWRVSFFLSSLNVFLPFSLYSVSLYFFAPLSSSPPSSLFFFTWNEGLWRQWPQYQGRWMPRWMAATKTSLPCWNLTLYHTGWTFQTIHAYISEHTCGALKHVCLCVPLLA